jgi:hypothetical protein
LSLCNLFFFFELILEKSQLEHSKNVFVGSNVPQWCKVPVLTNKNVTHVLKNTLAALIMAVSGAEMVLNHLATLLTFSGSVLSKTSSLESEKSREILLKIIHGNSISIK